MALCFIEDQAQENSEGCYRGEKGKRRDEHLGHAREEERGRVPQAPQQAHDYSRGDWVYFLLQKRKKKASPSEFFSECSGSNLNPDRWQEGCYWYKRSTLVKRSGDDSGHEYCQ
jgi:hypothetical protein